MSKLLQTRVPDVVGERVEIAARARNKSPYRWVRDVVLRALADEERTAPLAVASADATEAAGGIPEAIADRRALFARVHELGIQRETILRQLEADALAMRAGDPRTAAVLAGAVGQLRLATYRWHTESRRWILGLPGGIGVASPETVSPDELPVGGGS